jgi:hypothetical protein
VHGFEGVAVGGAQLDGVLAVVRRQLAKTPGTRLIVIGKEGRTFGC